MATFVWNWLERPGLDVAVVRHDRGEQVVEGHVVVSWDGPVLDVRYRLACDEAWVFSDLSIRTVFEGTERHLNLRHDAGGWWAGGQPRPDLAAAVDIDIMATPLTNTLPIRRVAWAPGQQQDFTMAYVRVPGLTVVPVSQRYTALGPGRFRYELVPGASYAGSSSGAGYHQVDDGFTAELEVDREGFVLGYPPYWRRLADA